MAKTKYKQINMPKRFMVTMGDVDYGIFNADDFGRLDDGTYVVSRGSGSPLFIRCLKQRGDVLDVEDGTGEKFSMTLVPLPVHD